MTDSPITPPPELRRQWLDNDDFPFVDGTNNLLSITKDRLNSVMDQAANWGADQELEASVNWLIENQNPRWAVELRTARRPKPPSLAEQALKARDRMWNFCSEPADWELVRVALVRLQELEKGNE